MFKGTVRSNLDPFDEKSDPEMWEALDMVGLGGGRCGWPWAWWAGGGGEEMWEARTWWVGGWGGRCGRPWT